ncbi:type II and III secretion system protein family protein [Massilia sp. YIM B02443]|uniref:type II and III secretion system protein family protein n=1 Tax=Massilia sp. YIM B02443 TaxID=3050127 RepID=UPI0025B71703|nr:type II and III secretion system protein family protein [Massilia sp. YIM B02443]MDN4038004.1 type II and III secretion system protein family protein [Massilia sp. YIM B02443]
MNRRSTIASCAFLLAGLALAPGAGAAAAAASAATPVATPATPAAVPPGKAAEAAQAAQAARPVDRRARAAAPKDAPKEARQDPWPAARGDAGCTGEAARPAAMALQMGKSTMLRLPERVARRSVGNPAVVQAMLVAPDTLYIAGIDVGSTNMIVQGRSGACSVIDITVAMDPAALRATLAAAMPEEKDIQVLAAADSLVLTGTVSDAAAVARAAELAGAYVRRPLRQLSAINKDNDTDGVIAPAGAGGTGGGSGSGATTRVVNMLAVSAPQQVQLEVKVAEVARGLIERLETGTRFSFGSGSWTTTLATDFLSGMARGSLSGIKTNGNAFGVGADKQDSLVRILAEPNVLAISGQEGTFLAGGKFYIPVAQDNNKVTLEEKEFGVGLRFTPTVLAGGRINLKVAPEVSELSREGVGISAAGINGTAIMPLVTTRRASTTVQLYDGQSFAIGGLVRNNLVTSLKGLPGLGEVPVLGALFRSTDYQQDRSELVFLITARLVKPLPGAAYALPTDAVPVPTRAEVLLGGRLEGAAPAPAPASRPAAAPSAPAQTAGGFELK